MEIRLTLRRSELVHRYLEASSFHNDRIWAARAFVMAELPLPILRVLAVTHDINVLRYMAKVRCD